jgi:hypothetical protein
VGEAQEEVSVTPASLTAPSFANRTAAVGFAHRRIGRTSEGLTLLNQALEVIERSGESWFEAELYRLMGETLLTNVDLYHAELWFSRALTKART